MVCLCQLFIFWVKEENNHYMDSSSPCRCENQQLLYKVWHGGPWVSEWNRTQWSPTEQQTMRKIDYYYIPREVSVYFDSVEEE